MRVMIMLDWDPEATREGYGIPQNEWNAETFVEENIAESIRITEGVTDVSAYVVTPSTTVTHIQWDEDLTLKSVGVIADHEWSYDGASAVTVWGHHGYVAHNGPSDNH